MRRACFHIRRQTRLIGLALLTVSTFGWAAPNCGAGRYFKVDYPASTAANELRVAVTYTLWIPDGASRLRGLIVHQHGALMTASKESSTAAFDLHWQALAKKWDCALLGPCYQLLNDGDKGLSGSESWFDPRRGSEKAFLKALGEFAAKSGHSELSAVPWVLWGHSAGAIWSDAMTALHPDRVLAIYFRSGSMEASGDRPFEFPRPSIPIATYSIPMMCSAGSKETVVRNWTLTTFQEHRAAGGLIGFALDPRTGQECGDTRYFAIAYLDACLAMRLPDKWSNDQTPKPMDTSRAYLAPLGGDTAIPAAQYKGDPKEAVWLPDEAVARAWMQYVKTGAVGDITPPPVPFDVRVTGTADQKTQITWSAEADLESGIGRFILLRDGKEFADVPEKPMGRFGRPLFQSMTDHDTPSLPLLEMRYVDALAKAGEKHRYAVITVNSVGLQSQPSAEAPLPYLRVNSAISYEVDPAWPERRQGCGLGGDVQRGGRRSRQCVGPQPGQSVRPGLSGGRQVPQVVGRGPARRPAHARTGHPGQRLDDRHGPARRRCSARPTASCSARWAHPASLAATAAISTSPATWSSRPRATSSSPTVTATPGWSTTIRTGSSSRLGASWASDRASSTCHTPSPSIPAGGSTLPTATMHGSRYSRRTGRSSISGGTSSCLAPSG